MKRIASLLSMALLVSCSPSHPVDRVAAEDGIREAVFRYQLVSKGGSNAYLSLNGKDPTDAFIGRFADLGLPLGKVSQTMVTNPFLSVVDSKTGVGGVIYHVDSIKWISDREVEVVGGSHSGGMSANEFTYTVKWRSGKWTVTKAILNGES